MGPLSVVACIADLQEKSNAKQMSTQTKWSLETQQNKGAMEEMEKGREEERRRTEKQISDKLQTVL